MACGLVNLSPGICCRALVTRPIGYRVSCNSSRQIFLLNARFTPHRLHEPLLNGIEWGGQLNPAQKVRVACLRTRRMLL